MKFRIEPFIPWIHKEKNGIIAHMNDIAIDREDFASLRRAIPAIKIFAENAKFQSKMALLTGEYVWKEHIIYEREKSIDWFIEYLESLPKEFDKKVAEMIIDEEKKKIGQ